MNRAMERLRSWGMGERVLKTTLAVMLAWVLGALVPGGTDHPYFAPLAALLSFQVTIADSITAAVQRILGIVAGVTVALIVTHLVGENVWGVGLLIFLCRSEAHSTICSLPLPMLLHTLVMRAKTVKKLPPRSLLL